MKTEPRSWPMAPMSDEESDQEVLEQAEPDFTLDGRCLTCLRYLPASGRCICEQKAS